MVLGYRNIGGIDGMVTTEGSSWGRQEGKGPSKISRMAIEPAEVSKMS